MMKLRNMVQGMIDDTPARSMLEQWEHDSDTLTFWRASSNFVYTFENQGTRFFLRFIHDEDNTIEHIQAELDYIQYLSANGYSAAQPVQSLHGNWIETIATEHGQYFGVVFEQAAGRPLASDTVTREQMERYGQSMAKLHLLAEAYPNREDYYRQSWMDHIVFIAQALNHHPKHAGLNRLLRQLQTELEQLPACKRQVGLIHYDFEWDNVLYDESKGEFSVFDFDDALYHWYMMDITKTICDLKDHFGDSALDWIKHFLSGYRTTRSLDEQALNLTPVFQRFSDLYSIARLLQCLGHFDPDVSPAWAAALARKLNSMIVQLTERCLTTLQLNPVSHQNWFACTQLEASLEQTASFPVPAVYWLAEAAYCGYTPLAILWENQIVGLSVYAVDPDDGRYWIMAFMIDRKYQRRGLGRLGMESIISYIREQHGCSELLLGHRPDNLVAARLYESLGFQEISRERNEIIRCISI